MNKILTDWLCATPQQRSKMGNPFLQMFAQIGEEAPVIKNIEDKKQMAYDNMVDLEIDDLKEEKLAGKAKEDTMTEEETMKAEQQQEDECKWGPDNIERN